MSWITLKYSAESPPDPGDFFKARYYITFLSYSPLKGAFRRPRTAELTVGSLTEFKKEAIPLSVGWVMVVSKFKLYGAL